MHIMDSIKNKENFDFVVQQTANFSRTEAQEVAANVLQSTGGDIDAFYCHNDEMALGVSLACQSAGLKINEDVYIIGVDGMYETFDAIKDGITVLKDGHYMGTWKTEELSEYDLLKTMLGKKEVKLERTLPIRDFSDKEDILEVRNLIRVPYVNDVSFHIKKGEILGLAGLLGAGRTETARIIFGCDHPDSGEIYVDGKNVRIKSPEEAIRAGLAFCTENRREEGIFQDVTVQNNLTICSLDDLTKGGFINSRKRKQLSDDYIQKLLIKTPSGEQLIKNLSGGNQQKVILSRWMAIHPKLIILDEPTRGIDVGAKAEIEKLIHDFSDNGISVLFISSEMAELVRNCDRILVLRDGKIMGELTGQEISEKSIMETIATGKEK